MSATTGRGPLKLAAGGGSNESLSFAGSDTYGQGAKSNRASGHSDMLFALLIVRPAARGSSPHLRAAATGAVAMARVSIGATTWCCLPYREAGAHP